MLKTAGRWLWRISRTLLVFYVLALVALYFFQEKLLFHPGETLAQDHEFRLTLPFEELRVPFDGAEVHALLVKAKKPGGLIVYFHGNAGTLSGWAFTAEAFAERFGWNVLILDYPGFGKSGGSIRSEAQLHALAKEAFSLAKEKAGTLPLVLYGRSIGSGLAVRLAAENKVDGLVLETPYLSMLSLAGGMFPWVPGFVLRYPLRSDLLMPQVSCPTLILHGDQDELIPYQFGLALSKLTKDGRLVTIEGGHHNDLGDSDLFWAEAGIFLNRISASARRP